MGPNCEFDVIEWDWMLDCIFGLEVSGSPGARTPFTVEYKSGAAGSKLEGPRYWILGIECDACVIIWI